MHSTLSQDQADPQRVLIARVDEELAHTREQIALADEQLAKLERDAARYPSGHPQTRKDAARPVPGNRPSPGGRAMRGFMGLLLAACIGVAAIVWQSPYGDAARQVIARWVPPLVQTSSQPIENPGLSGQPISPAARAVAVQTASPPIAPLAQTEAQDLAPTAAPVPPELAQLLETMARDLANVAHGIEQLKASQEQMASDNAKTVEQFKASQEQMTRLIAKASEQLVAKTSEQKPQPKTSALPPRPIATPTRKRVPTLPSRQAGERAQAPTQLRPEER